MVIETFLPGARSQVYERFHRAGRLLPEGLRYIDSWPTKDGARCFQLMETVDPQTLERWADRWRDLVSFEFVELGDAPVRDDVH